MIPVGYFLIVLAGSILLNPEEEKEKNDVEPDSVEDVGVDRRGVARDGQGPAGVPCDGAGSVDDESIRDSDCRDSGDGVRNQQGSGDSPGHSPEPVNEKGDE